MRIKRILCAFCFVIILCLTTVQPAFAASEQVLPSGIAYSDIEQAIDDFIAENTNPSAGVATAIFDQSNVIYLNFWGDANREAGIPVDAQTVMEWGSVSKLTVWVSVMQLWEQGKIDLSEDIRTYLPEGFLKNLRFEKAITMMDLMNHTAGFEEFVFGLNADDEDSILSLEETLSKYQPAQHFEPGVVQAYSNYGAALAGYIVECISDQPFDEYVKENIFEPLGMMHSALLPDLSDNTWVQNQRAQLHCYRTDGSLISDGREYVNAYPCGMCSSTLEDMMVFGQAMLNPSSQLFENAETYEAFFQPSAFCGDTDIPSCCHGFWPIDGNPDVLCHQGNTKGCTSALYLDLKTQTGMVIMTNQQSELIYTYLMPRRVFFKDSEQESPYAQLQDVSGFAEYSRSVWEGPLKLYRLANVTSLSTISGHVIETDSFGVHRYSFSGGDFLSIDTVTVVLMRLSVVLWVIAEIFSMIYLLVRMIFRLRHKKKSVLGAWGTWSCVLQLPFPLLMLPIALTLSSLEWWPIWCYKLCFIGAFVTGLAMLSLFAIGILHWRKTHLVEKKQRILRAILLTNLMIAIWNIGYWNLFMFWVIL